MPELQLGLTGVASDIVSSENTASRWGSGLVEGFATPALVLLMENAAFNATKDYLAARQTTVGVQVNIQHLAATPVGMRVRARAKLVKIDGRNLEFEVEAWDDVEKIGHGTHTRSVVDLERFEQRLAAKQTKHLESQ